MVIEYNGQGTKYLLNPPSIVNLLFHFVRSPIGTSILMGTDDSHDTIDLEVINNDLKGLALRDLELPNDTLI